MANLLIKLNESILCFKSNYLKVPIGYFFEDFATYLQSGERMKDFHLNINYNFLAKIFSELTEGQRNKLSKNLEDIKTVTREREAI